MKKHANVYVIRNEKIKDTPIEQIVEVNLARKGIRARCFSIVTAKKVQNVADFDWNIQRNLQYSLIESCDVCVIYGSYITPKMRNELEMAQQAGKDIVSLNINPEYLKKMNIIVSPKKLSTICNQLLSGEGGEKLKIG